MKDNDIRVIATKKTSVSGNKLHLCEINTKGWTVHRDLRFGCEIQKVYEIFSPDIS